MWPIYYNFICFIIPEYGFPDNAVVKNSPANAGNMDLILGWGRCPGGGHGNLLQYFCLKNPMDRGAWRATVCGVTEESDTTERMSMHIRMHSAK